MGWEIKKKQLPEHRVEHPSSATLRHDTGIKTWQGTGNAAVVC